MPGAQPPWKVFTCTLPRFVPGTAAGAVNFQAFLLDGLSRWNTARVTAAIQSSQKESLRTFDTRLKDKVNALSQSIHGKAVFLLYNPPSQYTGELLGVKYLYDQVGYQLYTMEENLDKDIDEGFEDVEDDAPIGSIPPFLDDTESVLIAPPEDSDNEEKEEVLKNSFKVY